MSKLMKLALIGVGHVAQHQVAAIARIPEIRLTDAYDLDSAKAGGLPDATHVHASLDTLLRSSDADIILVSTPNKTHFEIARQVIEAGRAVIVEKPIATSDAELDELIELSERKGCFLAVALHAAYARDLIWWVGRMQAEPAAFGRLRGFHAGFFDPYVVEGQLLPPAADLSGSWFDSGINALSVIGRIIDPDSLQLVEAHMSAVPQFPCSQIQGSALFSFRNLETTGHGTVDTNWTLGLNHKVTRIFYDDAQIILDHSRETVVIEHENQGVDRIDLRTDQSRLTNHYEGLFRHLIDMFEARRSNITVAARLHRLLFAASRSGTDDDRTLPWRSVV
jgi:D-galactose 1-dehydrogenase